MPVAGKLDINEASDVAAIIRGEVAQSIVTAKSNSAPNMYANLRVTLQPESANVSVGFLPLNCERSLESSLAN